MKSCNFPLMRGVVVASRDCTQGRPDLGEWAPSFLKGGGGGGGGEERELTNYIHNQSCTSLLEVGKTIDGSQNLRHSY